MGEELRNRIDIDSNRCPYCREAMTSEDSKVGCERCMAWQHRDCAEIHGSCTSCGHALTLPPAVSLAGQKELLDRALQEMDQAAEHNEGDRLVWGLVIVMVVFFVAMGFVGQFVF